MRKRTTTQKLNTAISNNLLHITSAEKYNKSTHKSDVINVDTFKDSLDFLCETIFADAIGWHYGWDHETGQYMAECSRMDRSIDIIIIAHLRVNEGMDREDIDKVLRVIEEE